MSDLVLGLLLGGIGGALFIGLPALHVIMQDWRA